MIFEIDVLFAAPMMIMGFMAFVLIATVLALFRDRRRPLAKMKFDLSL